MQPWLLPSLAALVIWSVQRVVSKAALQTLSTPQFYLLSAAVALPIYLPMLAIDQPPASAFPGALGVSALMALAFGVTTEAIRRGPLGRVSPITGLSPALTAVLALGFLGERPGPPAAIGIVVATGAVVLLAYRSGERRGDRRWSGLAVASLCLQGLGAFLAKVAVTPAGPTALLVTSAAVQLVVGVALVRRTKSTLPGLRSPLMRLTVGVLALAAVATIGYLWALSKGPASVIVPLVATSPALAGLVGAVILREPTPIPQWVGIALGLLGAVLLALPR